MDLMGRHVPGCAVLTSTRLSRETGYTARYPRPIATTMASLRTG
jgi:hypothetical protein